MKKILAGVDPDKAVSRGALQTRTPSPRSSRSRPRGVAETWWTGLVYL